MPGILDEINLLFGKSDLYDVLNVANTSSSSEIKKAYYKISLTVHPDKCEEKERDYATKKFQLLGKIYSILSDSNLRAVYDETGSVDEDESAHDQDRDWYEYWRKCFPKISVEDIEKFSADYKNSDEEKKDLIKLYRKHKGSMDKIMDGMMCSSAEDEPRFRGILEDLVREGELDRYDHFSSEAPKRKKARLAKYKDEEEEATKLLEELKRKNNIAASEDSLKALISKDARSRQERAGSFLDRLEEKYASPAKKTRQTKQKPKSSKKKNE